MALAILDIDGTLVDTNYHHALAWYRAFRASGIVIPLWRIHRHIGMGGDQLVGALTDARVERQHGDEIRTAEKGHYAELMVEVEPICGARELILDLNRRAHSVVLASSANSDEVERYLEMLDAHNLAHGWTTADDVGSTKPNPDLIHSALQKFDAPPGSAVMVGDSPWDVQAAARAKVPTLTVMSGGFAREELLQAGAQAVFESVAELRGNLDDTPLR